MPQEKPAKQTLRPIKPRETPTPTTTPYQPVVLLPKSGGSGLSSMLDSQKQPTIKITTIQVCEIPYSNIMLANTQPEPTGPAKHVQPQKVDAGIDCQHIESERVGKMEPISLEIPVTMAMEDDGDDIEMGLKDGKVGKSTQTATGSKQSDFSAAHTQTTGDYILRTAMETALIPTQTESRASQVSPRAKVKKRVKSTQSSETQTQASSPKPCRKRRKQKKVADYLASKEATTTNTGVQPMGDSGLFHLSSNTPSWPDLPVTDTQTQTLALLEELEATLGESISTQTRESFLANSCHKNQTTSSAVATNTQASCMNDTHQAADKSLLNSGELPDLGFMSDLDQASISSDSPSHVPKLSKRQMTDSGTDPLLSAQVADIYTEREERDSHSLNLPDPETLLKINSPTLANATNVETQTSAVDVGAPELLTSAVQTSQFGPAFTNTETQTAEDEMLNEFFSNMETQTTHDFLDDFGTFSDMERATTLEGLDSLDLTHVETQTNLQTVASATNPSQLTDMETQTLFPSLDLTDSHTQTTLESWQAFM